MRPRPHGPHESRGTWPGSTPRSQGALTHDDPPHAGAPPVTTILKTPKAWPAILLRRDVADPLDLAAARAAGAFEGLRRAVQDLGGQGTIAAVAASGLRGRGGSGFPTAEKWRAAAAAEGPDVVQPGFGSGNGVTVRRYVVGNGYGADPASQTDRTLLERNPYAVLEGAVIAA